MDGIMILCYIYAFLIGLCVASFINVVIYRVPRKLNFVSGRSFCPNCNTTLKPYDMVPVFSWLFLKGKCRFCHTPISIRYPLIELVGGLLGEFIFHHYGFSLMTPLVFVFSMLLLSITMVDFDTMEIPNGFIIFGMICAIIFMTIDMDITLLQRVIGIFIVSIPMGLLNLIVADSFGGGDIKLMGVCGFILGWQNIVVAMLIAILIAGTYALYLIVTKKINKKSHIAFGPYLSIGIFISLLYGDIIIHSYLAMFGIV